MKINVEFGDPPRDQSNKYAFIFSDDIKDWYGRGSKRREKQLEYYHANKNDNKSITSTQTANDGNPSGLPIRIDQAHEEG